MLQLHVPGGLGLVGKNRVNRASLTDVQVLLGPVFSRNDATNVPSVFKPTEVYLASYQPIPPKLPRVSLPSVRAKHW